MMGRLMRQFSYVMHARHDWASDKTVQLRDACPS
jgi:hypothetical protein